LSGELVGGIFWGRPTDQDVRQYLDLVVEELPHLRSKRRFTYLDLSRVEAVDRESFTTLHEFYTRHGVDLERAFEKIAGVHPPGRMGALLGGLPLVQPIPYPARFFASTAAALAFLGIVEPSFVEALETLRDQVANRSVVLSDLQKLLEHEPKRSSLAAAAKTLGMSDRSLQRRLSQLGSSFAAESTMAQIRVAQRLLLESDMTLLAIALEVGCSSAQHFSGMFRKATGESPSAWRTRRRA
jgi:AraC-like DNA-binding protein